MSEVTQAERNAIAVEFGYQTVMEIECAWCKRIIGYKDGFGTTGSTSGICTDCKTEGKGVFR